MACTKDKQNKRKVVGPAKHPALGQDPQNVAK